MKHLVAELALFFHHFERELKTFVFFLNCFGDHSRVSIGFGGLPNPHIQPMKTAKQLQGVNYFWWGTCYFHRVPYLHRIGSPQFLSGPAVAKLPRDGTYSPQDQAAGLTQEPTGTPLPDKMVTRSLYHSFATVPADVKRPLVASTPRAIYAICHHLIWT
jgi:hypothetical protein